jgi:hypothetical protein
VAESPQPGPDRGRPRAALDGVAVVEQAKGIVMALHRCGPEEAFELLRRTSQRANVKVRVLAERMVKQISSRCVTGLRSAPPVRPHWVRSPWRAGAAWFFEAVVDRQHLVKSQQLQHPHHGGGA